MSALQIKGAKVFVGDAFEEKSLFVQDGRIVEDPVEGPCDVVRRCRLLCRARLRRRAFPRRHGLRFLRRHAPGDRHAAIRRYQASRGVTVYCPATMTYPKRNWRASPAARPSTKTLPMPRLSSASTWKAPTSALTRWARKTPHTCRLPMPPCSSACKRPRRAVQNRRYRPRGTRCY